MVPSLVHAAPRRQPFHDASDAPERAAHGRALLRLLLAQDGSATRLCEAIAGGPVALQLVSQRVLLAVDADVPAGVREALPASAYLERITTLSAHGQVMSDNLSYIALDGLAPALRRELEAGDAPIGHLLARLWVRRVFLPDAPAVHRRLWDAVGQPDPAAARAYRVDTPEGPCMLIAETFRRGTRMAGDAA